MFIKEGKVNFKRLLIAAILVVIVGIGFFWRIDRFLVEKRLAKTLADRTLLIVIENNFMLPLELEENYEKHKNLVDTFFSYIFETDKKDFNNKNLAEIVDVYGEDYLAARFKNAAKGYGKIVILSDEKASYDNFKKVLINLNKEGKTIDIFLDLHGGANTIYFYNQEISKYSISRDKDFQRPLNLGYIYQTVCYGGENVEIWLDLGAQAVSGAREINNFVILAPERFLNLWTHGKTYYEAVEGGFSFEFLILKTLSRFLPNTIFSAKDGLEPSGMIFAGENDYKLE